jgi:hypothetical protein
MMPSDDVCCACGVPLRAVACSLPRRADGTIADAGEQSEGNTAACRNCYDVHNAGGVAALDVFLRATKEIREKQAKMRERLSQLVSEPQVNSGFH